MSNIIKGRTLEDTVLQRRDPSSLRRRDNLITVKDVLAILLVGGDEDDVRIAYPMIDDKSIRSCQAFLKSKFPQLYEEIYGPPWENFKILLDENIPLSLIPELHNFGHIDSVIMRGWSGKKDSALYRYAIGNGYDAIVTRDKAQVSSRQGRDLTNIALDLRRNFMRSVDMDGNSIVSDQTQRLPVLLTLSSRHPYRDGTLDTFLSKEQVIADLLKHKYFGVVSVTPGGVFPWDHTSNSAIWVDTVNSPLRLEKAIPKPIAKTLRVAQNTGNKLSKELLDYIRDRVESEHAKLDESADFEDILSVLDTVLQSLPDRMVHQEMRLLTIFEAAMKSVRKLYLNNSSLEPQNDPSPLPL